MSKSGLTEPDIYDADRTDANEPTELSVQLESNGPIIKPCENHTNVIDSPSLYGMSNPNEKSSQTYFGEID